jgi:UDP-GlcNAc:undecaprenyl-phosphate GlcNAc-1-phosphate transferase
MIWLSIGFAVALLASWILTAVVRSVARAFDVLDRPDGRRKLHQRSVPLWGGVAVYLAMVLGLLVAHCGDFAAGKPLDRLVWMLICLAGFVCLVGGIDDYRHLRPRVKLILQICSVLPLVFFGGWVDRITVFGTPLSLGWLGLPLTLLWLVGCINAINLLDGMDGLASIVGLATAAMMGLIATSEGHPHVTLAATVLGGALAGFLVYNLPPASIFLGDSGSMVIGLTVGVLGIEGAMKTSATLSITTPAVVMALPMFDVLLAVIRRKLTGRSFDSADRQHIHHRLLDRGLSNWQVLCIVGSLCLLTGAAATAATLLRSDTLACVVTVTLLVAVIRLRLFGHYELRLIKEAIAHSLASLAGRLFVVHGGIPPTPAELAQLSPEQTWDLLTQEVAPWHVRRLELSVLQRGRKRQERIWLHPESRPSEAYAWTVTVSFDCEGATQCQLRAALLDNSGPAPLYLSGLARLLKVFGRHMADDTQGPPILTFLGPSAPPPPKAWLEPPEEAA